MSLALVYSRANIGINAQLIEVEVHLSPGMANFSIVGMPEAVVKESKDRVRSAIKNSLFDFPYLRITVNLAPADLPKEGGRYELAIALGILAASKQIKKENLTNYEFGGELALSGELRPFHGPFPMVIAAAKENRTIILPVVNAISVAHIQGAKILQANNLLAVCQHLQGISELKSPIPQFSKQTQPVYPDLADVCGQHQAKRALEIAAAGGHSMLMMGSPGAGKTMLANRLPGLLPNMSDEEALETAAIHSIANEAQSNLQNWYCRPFRTPHHSASSVSLIGGGRNPRPGEVSLSHNGVLFLDEFPEFNRSGLEALREPLEAGEVLVSRAAYSIRYPARFQLIAAMNPCPCGHWGDDNQNCKCSPEYVARYQAKISGPLLDRIDLRVFMRPVKIKLLLNSQETKAESSSIVKQRVVAARNKQFARSGKLNQTLSNSDLGQFCFLNHNDSVYMEEAINQLKFSARAYHRTLKIARTIADLDNHEKIQREHLQEALIFRQMAV